ncbi:hypothetical protein BKA61DRAFT_262085 [Leptodontidium sp. MPI-SDFR-AT-0119]|nr:hypothetical protein BKA61DRAFT_262085 [Leptodontidium sp. MPI-SDFR-AT-0119]
MSFLSSPYPQRLFFLARLFDVISTPKIPPTNRKNLTIKTKPINRTTQLAMPRAPAFEAIESVLHFNTPPYWMTYHIDDNHPVHNDANWEPQSASELDLLWVVHQRALIEGPEGRHRIVMTKRLKVLAKVTFRQINDAATRCTEATKEVKAAEAAVGEIFEPVATESFSSWNAMEEVKRRLDLQENMEEMKKNLEDREARLMGRIARFEKFRRLLLDAGEWEEVDNELRGHIVRPVPVSPSPAVVPSVNSSPTPRGNAAQKASRPPLVRRNAGSWIVSWNN